LLRPGIITSASLKTNGNLLVAVRHTNEKGESHYYDELGNPIGNYFLRYPLSFSRISSTFSYSRFHPVLKRARPHNGVDFAAPVGTPVRAVGDGIIEISGMRGAAGNMVKISHGNRWSTAYLHLHRISKDVRPGTRVSRGQVIGTVGSTGLSTGPHLHFSLYDRGRYVDPLKTNLPSMSEGIKPLAKEYLLAALEDVRAQHLRVAAIPGASTAG
jgi:murein DD-endopeptidase MepM/ murein hydrolase activator NlpD